MHPVMHPEKNGRTGKMGENGGKRGEMGENGGKGPGKTSLKYFLASGCFLTGMQLMARSKRM